MPENEISYLSWSSKIHHVAEKVSQTRFRASSIYEASAVARQRSDLVESTYFVQDGHNLLFISFRGIPTPGIPTPGHYMSGSGVPYLSIPAQMLGVFGEPYSSHNDARYPVRQVDPSPDYTAIRAWLGHCRSNHTECGVGKEFDLSDIYLVDVNTRTLVRYPPGAEYVTLSYVWGKTTPPHSDRNARLPENLPQTIDHAIIATRNLGFSYIWIDTLCIDQANHAEKKYQISLMDRIYEAAIATLVALDGIDADSGLGGVGTGCTRFPQLFAQFGPYKALSRCPNFASESVHSVWSKRGWTFQEEVLSRRCVFFTRHQVYYRCESMFCSEDYHDQKNFGFSRTDQPTANFLNSPFDNIWKPSLQNTGCGLYVLPEQGADLYDRHEPSFRDYRKFLNLYLVRNLSYQEDNLNAFSAILNRLEKRSLPGKFAGGLPLDFMRQALQWDSLYEDCEVRLQSSNSYLPSWSWVGWKINRIDILNRDMFPSSAVQPPLRIWTFNDVVHRDGYLIPDLNTKKEHINMVDLEDSVDSSQNAWIKHSKNSDMSSITDDWNKNSVPETAIFVEATLVTFHKRNFQFNFSPVSLVEIGDSSARICRFAEIYRHDKDLKEYLKTKDSSDFILLSQDENKIVSILLDWNDGMAARIGLIALDFDFKSKPSDIPKILGRFDMRVARFLVGVIELLSFSSSN